MIRWLRGNGDEPFMLFNGELHLGNGAIQAARWDDWKAVRNGVNKPIEIYDLATDPAEQNNLAGSRPELVAKAETILKEAHRPDPHWPLDHRTEKQKEIARKTWEHKRWRDQTGWSRKTRWK